MMTTAFRWLTLGVKIDPKIDFTIATAFNNAPIDLKDINGTKTTHLKGEDSSSNAVKIIGKIAGKTSVAGVDIKTPTMKRGSFPPRSKLLLFSKNWRSSISKHSTSYPCQSQMLLTFCKLVLQLLSLTPFRKTCGSLETYNASYDKITTKKERMVFLLFGDHVLT